MAINIADTDNIRQSFTGDGTTTITLGASIPKHRLLSAKLTAGQTAFMVARGKNTGDISVGEFTYNGATVSQTAVFYSSNGGSPVAFPNGTDCEIYLDMPSRMMEILAYASYAVSVIAFGANRATNAVLELVFSAASVATGLRITGAAAGAGLALAVASSGTNEALTLNAKGSGTIGIGSVSTGRVTITPVTTITGALTLSAVGLVYDGKTLTGSTGTGNMVLSASPTFTGTLAAAAGTFSSTLGVAGVLSVTNNTAATSTTTGALVVTGGLGIGGAGWFGGAVNITSSTASTSTTTGAAIVTGGLGVGGRINVGSNANIAGTLDVGNGGLPFASKASITDSNSNASIGIFTVSNTDGTAGRQTMFIGCGSNGADTTSVLVRFMDGGLNTTQGSITRNGNGAVLFNVASDIRMKSDVQTLPLDEARGRVLGLRPVSYMMMNDPFRSKGLIAQEAFLVNPEMVHVGDKKNLRPGDEGFDPWSVDLSKAVVDLIAHNQWLDREISKLMHSRA